MSYSQDTICYAVSHGDTVGIDIEHCILQTNLDELIYAVTTSSERALLISYTNNKKLDSFYRLWCQKEATLKAIGTGLYYPLNLLETHNLQLTQAIKILPHDTILHPTTIYYKAIEDTKSFKVFIASPIKQMEITPCDDTTIPTLIGR